VPKGNELNLIGRKLTDTELKDFLNDSIKETDATAKGKEFERFFENFMAQQMGFNFIRKHCRSKVGEIDYFYRINHKDHPLWNSYDYVFIECKNWKDKISSKEIDHFINLLKAKKPFKCFGVYLTTSSLSPEAQTSITDSRKMYGTVIIPLERPTLLKLIENGFKSYLEKACDQLVSIA
jgi:restriction endonuclease Mrr